MRIRCIKPEFYVSESIGRLSRDARLLFIGLWSFADDSGRGRGALPAVSGALFPYDDDALKLVDSWFGELEQEGMVRRYVADDGNTYYDIPKWLTHQKIEKPSKSKFPEFTESSPTIHRKLHDMSPLDQGSGIRDQGTREQVPMEVERVKRLAPTTTKERSPAGGIEEVKALFAAEGSTETEALKFFHFYEANGWVQGKNKPLVQWRSAAKNWIANNTKNGHINGHHHPSTASERRNAAIGDDPEWREQVRARIESNVEGFGLEFEHGTPPQDCDSGPVA